MRNKPECLNKNIVAKSRLFQIEQLDLRFSNGQYRQYERIVGSGHGAVLIVALDEHGYTYLVKEYAAGTDRYELGFPKGLIDAGEDSLSAANRELQEEIGLQAQHVELVKSVSLAPGYFGATLTIVLAQGLSQSRLPGDEPEPLDIVRWPWHDFETLLKRDDFTEARSIAAMYLVNQLINERKNNNE